MPSKGQPFNAFFLRISICYVNYFLHSCVTANTIKSSSITHTSTYTKCSISLCSQPLQMTGLIFTPTVCLFQIVIQMQSSKKPFESGFFQCNALKIHPCICNLCVFFFYRCVTVYYMGIPQIFSYATNIQNSFCFVFMSVKYISISL